MTKITLIGAGSLIFTRHLCSDILYSPALQDCTFSLMDIDAERLAQGKALVERLIEMRGVPARVEASLDRRQAVTGADYVFTVFQAGGLDAYKLDIDIPLRYGVGQCVGDTLGPGGVFRSLRTIPVLLDLCRELDEVAPDALLLNYANPMAANCWAIDELGGRRYVGLCHSVQDTSAMLARWMGVPYDELTYLCAGINHQSWFIMLKRGQEDLQPRLRQVVNEPGPLAREPVRIDLFKAFGYFVTESSGHASEYVPYFRKSAKMIEEDLVPRFTDPVNIWYRLGATGGYYAECMGRLETFQAEGHAPPPAERSIEYGSYIVEAIETGKPIRVNGNVPNRGLITNLPEGCCVEVPCLVDRAGVQPTVVGKLPPQLAALNRTNINVQSMIVEAARTGKRDAVHQAVALDPLTAAICTLPQIEALTDEMLAAQAQWLQPFA